MSVKEKTAIDINLFNDPPSLADIEAAKLRLATAIKIDQTRVNRLALVWCAFAAAAGAGVAAYWRNPLAGGAVVGLMLPLVAVFVAEDHGAEKSALAGLQPVSSDYLEDVIAACELDPRIDCYRRKVAQQHRELVIDEALAFRHWRDQGYESCNWAVLRSPEPIDVAVSGGSRKPALHLAGPTDEDPV